MFPILLKLLKMYSTEKCFAFKHLLIMCKCMKMLINICYLSESSMVVVINADLKETEEKRDGIIAWDITLR